MSDHFPQQAQDSLLDLVDALETVLVEVRVNVSLLAKPRAPQWDVVSVGTRAVVILVVHPEDVPHLPEAVRRHAEER